MQKVAIVTGSNQGLGLALVEGLCRTLGPDAAVYLTARDAGRGAAAVQQLRSAGVRPELATLDVTDRASVAALADHVRATHGGIDLVICNAAARISKDATPASQVATFVDTNNHGTHRMIDAFAPLVRDGGRFLVVASSFGSLRHLDPRLHDRFDVDRLSLGDLAATMDRYVAAVEAGRDHDEGWPAWINIASKVGQVAATKILARDLQDTARRRGILIDAVCPGLVDTAASRPWFDDMSSAQTPAQAAVDVIWLATLAAGVRAPYGELVRHREVLPWR